MKTLPQIEVRERQLRDITEDVFQALVAANDPPELFQRHGRLARVRLDERSRPRIDSVGEIILRNRVARVADCVRIARRTGEEVAIHVNPPQDVVGDVLALPAWPGIPALEAVTEVPVLRRDGTVITKPGYDAETKLVYMPAAGLRVPEIPGEPSPVQVASAMRVLADVLADFPFQSAADAANTIGLLLTPIVRPAIQGPTPLALIDKPKRGTGASLVVQVVQLVAMGAMTDLTTAPTSDEEWRKKITAALGSGLSVMFFDNVEHPLSSPSLAAALTAPEWSDRILGKSEIISVPNRATWIATGNNLKVGGDIARRCYWVRLDAGMGRPWTRSTFRHKHLLRYVAKKRGEILAALLTLVRHWFARGCPQGDVPKLGGFEEWSDTVGGVLHAAGVSGFLGNLDTLYDLVDEEENQWAAFLAAWFSTYTATAITVAVVVDDLRREGSALRVVLPEELADALGQDEKGKGSFPKRLGKALSKRAGAIFGDHHLIRGAKDEHAGVTFWLVRPAPAGPVRGFRGFADLVSAKPEVTDTPEAFDEPVVIENKAAEPAEPAVRQAAGEIRL